MPRANIYIRKEDEKKWAELKDKSEFVHNALNPVPTMVGGETFKSVDGGPFKPLKTPKVTGASKEAAIKEMMDTPMCRHYANPKFCKHAKPGKPCRK